MDILVVTLTEAGHEVFSASPGEQFLAVGWNGTTFESLLDIKTHKLRAGTVGAARVNVVGRLVEIPATREEVGLPPLPEPKLKGRMGILFDD